MREGLGYYDGNNDAIVLNNQQQQPAAVAVTSVTRSGEFFKAFGNNYFPQISHILRQFL